MQLYTSAPSPDKEAKTCLPLPKEIDSFRLLKVVSSFEGKFIREDASLLLPPLILMENPNFSATYHRHGSQEQLVTKMSDDCEEDDYDNEEEEEEEEDEELKEEEYDFAQVSVTPKHICFVTDSSLSSWSDPETHWEKTSCLG